VGISHFAKDSFSWKNLGEFVVGGSVPYQSISAFPLRCVACFAKALPFRETDRPCSLERRSNISLSLISPHKVKFLDIHN